MKMTFYEWLHLLKCETIFITMDSIQYKGKRTEGLNYYCEPYAYILPTKNTVVCPV